MVRTPRGTRILSPRLRLGASTNRFERSTLLSDFLDELKRRRVIRTVVAYAAAVFVVLQVADLTFDAIGLPSWSYRFLVILSIVGFPVTAISAWIFDLRSGTLQRTPKAVGEEARRAPPIVAAGVVAGTVAIAALATWVVRSGPPPAVALDDDLVAVVPFRVAASDPALSYLREGVVDLLAAKLTDRPRVVDPRTLLSAWTARAGSAEADLSEAEIVDLAGGLGAGRVLLGSIVGGPSDLTLTASLRAVDGDRVIAETTLPGTADSLTVLIDGLGARLLGAQAGVPLEQVTSTSIPAVRHYLEGRRLYRMGDFGSAFDSYDRALELDSTFAAAALEAISAAGMLAAPPSTTRHRRIAWDNRTRLGLDDQLYLRAVLGPHYPETQSILEGLDFLRSVAERLDRAEAWYQYGDLLLHGGHILEMPNDLAMAEEAFRRAVEQDPGFVNAALHLNWTLQFLGDSTWREVEVLPRPIDIETAFETVTFSAITDPVDRAEAIQRAPQLIDSLSWDALLFVPYEALSFIGTGPVTVELMPAGERASLRAIDIAPTPGQRLTAQELRWDFLANLERWDEALALARQIAAGGPAERRVADGRILEAAVLWDAELPDAVAPEAAARLRDHLRTAGPETASERADDVDATCALGLYAVATGDDDGAREVADALRTDATDDATHRNAMASIRRTCVRLLEARLAFPDDLEPLERLGEWLAVGPPGIRARLVANFESARMWDAAGDLEQAETHARRQDRGPLALTFLRPMDEIWGRAFEQFGPREGSQVWRDRSAVFAWDGWR